MNEVKINFDMFGTSMEGGLAVASMLSHHMAGGEGR
jgi:hypothetical protein